MASPFTIGNIYGWIVGTAVVDLQAPGWPCPGTIGFYQSDTHPTYTSTQSAYDHIMLFGTASVEARITTPVLDMGASGDITITLVVAPSALSEDPGAVYVLQTDASFVALGPPELVLGGASIVAMLPGVRRVVLYSDTRSAISALDIPGLPTNLLTPSAFYAGVPTIVNCPNDQSILPSSVMQGAVPPGGTAPSAMVRLASGAAGQMYLRFLLPQGTHGGLVHLMSLTNNFPYGEPGSEYDNPGAIFLSGFPDIRPHGFVYDGQGYIWFITAAPVDEQGSVTVYLSGPPADYHFAIVPYQPNYVQSTDLFWMSLVNCTQT